MWLFALSWMSCSRFAALDAPAPPTEPPRPLRFEISEDLRGVRLELSEADPPQRSTGPAPIPPAEHEILPVAQVEGMFGALPDLPHEAGDSVAFAKRADSLPPPRTGATVAMDFPSTSAPPAPAVDTGPLVVRRFSPEGDVDLAPRLSVTFSQPMVALMSQDRASLVRPVRISPEPPGQWRWLGTKTVVFEPDPRFPMATTYNVSIDPETVSATGTTIDAGSAWTFATPPPTLVASFPDDGPHGLNPTVALVFDQAVPKDLAAHVALFDGSATRVPLIAGVDPATADDPWIAGIQEDYLADRIAFLRPAAPLKPATHYTLEVGAGLPSAEGPGVTKRHQSGYFHTYRALGLAYTQCDRTQTDCSPAGSPYLGFVNPLDTDAFDPAWVTVVPPIDGLRVQVAGAGLSLSGRLTPATTYTVTVQDLRDIYGQSLAAPVQTTFTVGHAPEQLIGPPQDLVVLDPAGPAALSVFSVNLKRIKVRAYAVTPEDFPDVSSWMRNARYDAFFHRPIPARRLASTRVPVEGFADDEMIETAIDLTEWLGEDGFGHVLLWIEPPSQPRNRWERTDHFVWVQRTALGLTAIVDDDHIRGWATSLADGSALEGVSLQLLGEGGSRTTDADGLVTLPKYTGYGGPHVLVARRGSDVAMLPQTLAWWNQYGGWTHHGDGDRLVWFVFDDRTLYKPGETVSVKGWIRREDTTAGGGVDGVAGIGDALTFAAADSQGNPIGTGEVDVSPTGAFDLEFTLPDTPNLGAANLQLEIGGGSLVGSYVHAFQIQEFRRPEFEVRTTVDPGPYVLGQQAVVSVEASYYAGGALPGAPVDWAVTASPAAYAPPGLSAYRFGPQISWWSDAGMWGRGGQRAASAERRSLTGTTDTTGGHRVAIDFVAMNPPRPFSVRAEATVVDVNRQRWTQGEVLLLHPSDHYVGLATDRGFYDPDSPIEVSIVVSDLDGALVPDRNVDLTFARLDWIQQDGRWQYVEEAPASATVASAAEAVSHTFVPSRGGAYRIRARTTDGAGRPNETVMEVWVSGGAYAQAPSRQVTLEAVTLVADRDSWQPGQTAEILVVAPFAPAEGLLTVGRGGVLETRRFTMSTASTTLEIPITETSVPSLTVAVDLVGATTRRDDAGDALSDKAERVAVARGELALSVPPLAQTLSVAISPRHDAVDPGSRTTLDVEVRDARGAPVVAEVAVVVVDESVLALADRQTPDPLAAFYATKGGDFVAHHNRTMVVLADPDAASGVDADGDLENLRSIGYLDTEDNDAWDLVPMEEAEESREYQAAAPGQFLKLKQLKRGPPRVMEVSGNVGGSSSPRGPALREDFSAQALFVPHVVTDAAGRAAVTLQLPDSLTRYRILAVAVSGDHFGVDESAITARRPVMVRPSPPRFLNFGDRAEVPVVVQNQTTEPITVDLGLRMSNARVVDDVAQAATGPVVTFAGRRFEVPAGDRREIRVPIAAVTAGRVRMQAVVRAGEHTDAAEFDFPVWTPATSEAFATYGELDDGAIVQPVAAPDDVWPQFGGLEITTSSTALSALTDAVLYLTQYPYDCTEQMASRVMAVAALQDVLAAFGSAQLPDPEMLQDAVHSDLRRIRRRQHHNGGFSYWPALRDEPYLTIHVAHALVRARDADLAKGDAALANARRYLRRIESHIPWWYSTEAKWSLRAYALHVLHLAGEDDVKGARNLLDAATVDGLPLEAQGWIAPVLAAGGRRADVDALIRHWDNRISETASTAQFDVSYSDDQDYVLLHSSRRTDAILLDSLMRVQPDHDVIPKLVRGLLGHRRAGRWSTTQENAFVLLALDAYFRRFEATTPDFVARVWLGDAYAGDRSFRGRTTDRGHLEIPMAQLTDPGDLQDLVLSKEGPGRLYYRIGMRYAPADLHQEPADRGFTLQRRYEAIDDPADVVEDDDGTWRIAAGAQVRVRLTMVSEARRTHVALVDAVPGGFEPANPDLATTGTVPADPNEQAKGRYWWWRQTWFEHQNLRDERVEAFTSLLYDGVFEYTYVATATTPGHFVAPPAKVEEMYHPETFGRTGTDRVVIE